MGTVKSGEYLIGYTWQQNGGTAWGSQHVTVKNSKGDLGTFLTDTKGFIKDEAKKRGYEIDSNDIVILAISRVAY